MTAQLSREDVKELRNSFQCWQQDYDPKYDAEQYEMFGRAITATDMLLAGMSSEPVIIVGNDGGDALAYRRLIQSFEPGTKLYTAPPAQMAVPECFVRFHQVIKERHHGRMPEEVQKSFDECAAMLNAGPEKQKITLREGIQALRDLGGIDAEKILAERDYLNGADVSDLLIAELLTIAKTAAEEADEYGHCEYNDDSESHTKAIAEWEQRAGMIKAGPVTATKVPESRLEQEIFQACKHFLLCSDGSGKNYDGIFYDPETELSFNIYELAEKLGIVKCTGNRCWSLLPQVRDEIDAVYRKYALLMLAASPPAPEQEV